nr:MAG TPA: hypothetical protein [Caudoviricetes sp.]
MDILTMLKNFLASFDFSDIVNRDNITLALAIFGSIGTLFSCLHTLIINRKNLHLRIVGHRITEKKSLLLFIVFENKSRLPIAITGISFKYNDVFYPCSIIPIVALEETLRCKNEILSHHEYTSISIPLAIQGLGGTSGYVYFETPELSLPHDATHLNFSIYTNRGKVIEKTLELGKVLD